MSKQVVFSFISKVNGDVDWQQQVKGVDGNLGGLIGVAGKAGYSFTAEDWNGAIAELAAGASGELSETELDQVAGGGIGLMQPPDPTLNFRNFLGPQLTVKL